MLQYNSLKTAFFCLPRILLYPPNQQLAPLTAPGATERKSVWQKLHRVRKAELAPHRPLIQTAVKARPGRAPAPLIGSFLQPVYWLRRGAPRLVLSPLLCASGKSSLAAEGATAGRKAEGAGRAPLFLVLRGSVLVLSSLLAKCPRVCPGKQGAGSGRSSPLQQRPPGVLSVGGGPGRGR